MMPPRKCFGTMLWDAADEQCRTCDVFDACRQSLNKEKGSLNAETVIGINAHARTDAEAHSESLPLQATIEAAFSDAPAAGQANHEGLKTPLPRDPGRRATKKLIHFSTRLPEGLDIDLKVYCVVNKMTVQTFMAQAIKDRLLK
jgi:hypothetical protein